MRKIGMLVSIAVGYLRVVFGKFPSDEKIPDGPYCYTPLEFPSEENGHTYRVEPCPYYKYVSKRYRGCSYLGVLTDDSVFADQCKMCHVKKDYLNGK